MTRGAKRTAAVVGGATVALLAYEAYTLANGDTGENAGDTISEVIWAAVARHPIVPAAIGGLAAHLLWQKRSVYQELSR
ncbi:MAG TPA: hypothetical protein PK308_05250 [Phycisphaerales bacterium]|nr:hypothetical protein [Phycisphaerales bacterium]